MEVIYYWSGTSFSLLEYLSVLSTSMNTRFTKILLYYDSQDHPANLYWDLLDQIPRVSKRSGDRLLAHYFACYSGRDPAKIVDKRVRADLFRYGYLHEFGGAWLDLDTLQVRDVAMLAAQREFTLAWEYPDRKKRVTANIAVMAFPPGHEILAGVLAGVAGALGRKNPSFDMIGPPLITEVIRRLGREREVLAVETFYPVRPDLGAEVLFGNYALPEQTWSIHVWAKVNRHFFLGKQVDAFAAVRSTFFDLANQLIKRQGSRDKV